MDSIKKLTDLFTKFPTIGTRTAGRFVFYLLKLPSEKIDELVQAIQELKNKIKFCSFCFNPHEPFGTAQGKLETTLCFICQNTLRNRKLLCVVEKEADLILIENTKRYNGLYFILGGYFSALKKIDIDNLKVKELKERIENPQKFGLPKIDFTEIIIATNPTPEGKVTSVLIERTLKELPQFSNSPSEALAKGGFKITHLAKGLPVGGELEYADEETLESAFEGRK